jgi:hypothetical protein
MSAIGTFETWRERAGTSAMGGIADVRRRGYMIEVDAHASVP